MKYTFLGYKRYQCEICLWLHHIFSEQYKWAAGTLLILYDVLFTSALRMIARS